MAKAEFGKAIMLGDGFADEAKGANVERLALSRRRMLEPACVAEFLHQRHAGRIDIAVVDRQIGLAPALEAPPPACGAGLRRTASSDKLRRPCQLPSNTGFCFAAKAR